MVNTAAENTTASPAASPAKNRLIGWLVSYEMDARGKAFEIRSGRTIISTENSGRSRVITLKAQDISTPHMALNATPKHTLLVQDIFSESGSFLRKASSNEDKPITGPVELGHGDWIRIGSQTRFQVCLIDGPIR